MVSMELWGQAVLALIGAGGAVGAARSARRTKRQEKRDDFTTITDRMEREITRQGGEIQGLKAESATQQDQIIGQGAAIAWLVTDRHSLVGYIRKSGLEPPAPRPIPIRARPFLDHIDV
ncbi:hypothetical protein [Streptomyces formicae]|uniref:Secreted protein n=1 Tax=Streptomyces formicae TaxID=1616117 RepID=A0ABY3WM91_9ACTN|nr:hypothetical protein [Streptomyces formicae]UNM13754.1 hypothetical protein J4032_21905 [Streptomyces formicae]